MSDDVFKDILNTLDKLNGNLQKSGSDLLTAVTGIKQKEEKEQKERTKDRRYQRQQRKTEEGSRRALDKIFDLARKHAKPGLAIDAGEHLFNFGKNQLFQPNEDDTKKEKPTLSSLVKEVIKAAEGKPALSEILPEKKQATPPAKGAEPKEQSRTTPPPLPKRTQTEPEEQSRTTPPPLPKETPLPRMRESVPPPLPKRIEPPILPKRKQTEDANENGEEEQLALRVVNVVIKAVEKLKPPQTEQAKPTVIKPPPLPKRTTSNENPQKVSQSDPPEPSRPEKRDKDKENQTQSKPQSLSNKVMEGIGKTLKKLVPDRKPTGSSGTPVTSNASTAAETASNASQAATGATEAIAVDTSAAVEGIEAVGAASIAAGIGLSEITAGASIVIGAFAATAAAVSALAQKFIDSQKDLAKYNGGLAAAYANSTVRGVQRDIERGKETGEGTAKLIQSFDNMKDAFLPLVEAVTNGISGALTVIVDLISGIATLIKPIFYLIKKIVDLLNFIYDILTFWKAKPEPQALPMQQFFLDWNKGNRRKQRVPMPVMGVN